MPFHPQTLWEGQNLHPWKQKKPGSQPAIPGLRCALPQSFGLQCSLGRVWTKTQVIEHRLDSCGRGKMRDTAFCSFLAVSSFCRSLHILKWLLAREKNVSPGLEDALQHEWGTGQYGGMAGPGRGSLVERVFQPSRD